MKRLTSILLILLGAATGSFGRQATHEEYLGAWTSTGDDKGRPVTSILIVTERYFTIASFITADHHFLLTSGGSYKIDGDRMVVTIDYHSNSSHMVGKTHVLQAKPTGKGYKLTTRGGMVLGDWVKIDGAQNSALAGIWLASSYVDDKGDTVKTDFSVRTVKFLSDTRFQWVAYNTSTNKFIASAGGTYVASRNGYTEKIEFYADADDKIGKTLNFDCSIEGRKWIHAGMSSIGAPLYELWSKR